MSQFIARVHIKDVDLRLLRVRKNTASMTTISSVHSHERALALFQNTGRERLIRTQLIRSST